MTFQERQRFTQWWLWLVVLGVAALEWLVAFAYVLGRDPAGSPAADVMIVVFWLLAGVALPLLFMLATLRTEVREDGVYCRLFPLHRKFRNWPFESIASAEPRTYAPIREYGGWGIRSGPGGRAYNTSGNRGVQLVLRTGERILIGSQQPERLAGAIVRGLQR